MNILLGSERHHASTPDLYQSLAAQTAYYEELENPERALEQGIKDEIIEMLEQAYGDGYWTSKENLVEGQLPVEDLKSEIGDLLWYGSQLLRVIGERFSAYVDSEQWIGIQLPRSTKYEDVLFSTLGTTPYSGYDFASRPIACLALQMVELDDAQYPLPTANAAKMNAARQALFKGITLVANLNGFTLEEAANANIAKLANRTRKPHTIEHVQDSLPSLADQKRKLWLEADKRQEI